MIFRARVPLLMPIQHEFSGRADEVMKIPCLAANFRTIPWGDDNLGAALKQLRPRADRINALQEDKRILLIDKLSKNGWIDWV